MDPYKEVIKRRGITRLCHFTKSSNLPYILGDGVYEENGIISTKKVISSKYLKAIDKNRFDGLENYVCCSIENINRKLFIYRRLHDNLTLFPDWAILYIDPNVISETSLFSPVNAATGNGKYVNKGVEAFEKLFADQIHLKNKIIYRKKELALNQPTDIQAEVLIKDAVPKDMIQAVCFPKESLEIEKTRMDYWYKGNIPIFKWEDKSWLKG